MPERPGRDECSGYKASCRLARLASFPSGCRMEARREADGWWPRIGPASTMASPGLPEGRELHCCWRYNYKGACETERGEGNHDSSARVGSSAVGELCNSYLVLRHSITTLPR